MGLAVGLAAAALLAWAPVLLGRFLMHEAAVRQDHALVVRGPYRLIRRQVRTGYLALWFGSGVVLLKVSLLLLRPVSRLGIFIQGASEEQLRGEKFGRKYERYAGRVGRLAPRLWTRATERGAAANRPRA